MVVDVVFEERYWYPLDGGIVWLSGYSPVDEDGRFLGRDVPELTGRGLIVAPVAGAGRHHAAELQADDAAPGRPLALVRDAANEHDPNAVRVLTAGGAQVGWVPRELAAQVAPELDAGAQWHAVVLRESRPSPRDARSGLTMLLGPEPLSLRKRDRPARRGR